MLGQRQVTAETWAEARVQLNTILGQLQQGAIPVNGLKFDRSRTSAPTTAPGVNDPNLVLVDVAGTLTLYLWDGSAWSAL